MPRVITVAVCGNKRKHDQSYNSFRNYITNHNARLLGSPAATPAPGLQSRENSINILQSEESGCTWASAAAECLYRLVNLNYDPEAKRMVLSTDDSLKGHQPYTSAAAVPDPDSDADEPYKRGEEAAEGDAAALLRRPLRVSDVDVLMHKVTSLGLTEPGVALEAWCARVNRRRARRSLPPMAIVDPFDKVAALHTRLGLYKTLDRRNPRDDFSFLVPPTFFWDCKANLAGGQDHVNVATVEADVVSPQHCEPIGDGSASWAEEQLQVQKQQHEETDAEAATDEDGRTTWWIAKPNEGTGPAFTHYLVMWRTRSPRVAIPRAVLPKLPGEPKAFVIQQFYTRVFPMVLKVYYVAPTIHLKFSPTVKFLSYLLKESGEADGEAAMERPIFIDSQRKDLFTTTGGNFLSGTFSSAQASGDFALSQASRRSTDGGESLGPVTPPPAGHAYTLECDAEAPESYWERFFASGTPARREIQRMSDQLSDRADGLGLSLFGFDVLLMPRQFANSYHRSVCPRGIGREEGEAEGPAVSGVSASSLRSLSALDMFDLETGRPTELLKDSVPIIIDVNYFPGYSGMPRVHEHMLDLVYTLCQGSDDANSKTKSS